MFECLSLSVKRQIFGRTTFGNIFEFSHAAPEAEENNERDHERANAISENQNALSIRRHVDDEEHECQVDVQQNGDNDRLCKRLARALIFV